MTPVINKLLGALTSTKGAVLAAPVILGTGLLMSIGSTQSTATPPETAQAGTMVLAQAAAAAPKPGQQATTLVSSPAKNEGQAAFTAKQEEAIGAIVRKYLLANPDVLVEVGQELERRQKVAQAEKQLKLISSQKKEIFYSPVDYVIGKEDSKITVVEYFDYNCGWCKRAVKEVSALVDQDPNIRVVMKEFPIFGEHSEFAAKAAMASKPQGKYWEFHVAMMKAKRVTKDNVFQIAQSVGVDVEKLKEEMKQPKYEEALRRNMAIAQSLGIQGTPGFIIDSEISPGYLPVAALKQKVNEIREKGCQVC